MRWWQQDLMVGGCLFKHGLDWSMCVCTHVHIQVHVCGYYCFRHWMSILTYLVIVLVGCNDALGHCLPYNNNNKNTLWYFYQSFLVFISIFLVIYFQTHFYFYFRDNIKKKKKIVFSLESQTQCHPNVIVKGTN